MRNIASEQDVVNTERAGQAESRRAPLAWSLAAGAIVFVTIVIAAAVFVSIDEKRYVARASALVLPAADLPADQLPDFYGTLADGEIVTTFTELVRLQELKASVAETLDIDKATLDAVTLEVQGVADTSVLQVAATADDEDTAIAVADGVLAEAQKFIVALGTPYAITIVGSATDNVEEAGLPAAIVLGGGFLVAIILAIAAQQGVYQLIVVSGVGSKRSTRGAAKHDAAPDPGDATAMSAAATANPRAPASESAASGPGAPPEDSRGDRERRDRDKNRDSHDPDLNDWSDGDGAPAPGRGVAATTSEGSG